MDRVGPFYTGRLRFQRVKMDRGSIFNGGPFSISHRHQVTEGMVIVFVDQIVIKTLTNILIVRCLEERQIVLNIVR